MRPLVGHHRVEQGCPCSAAKAAAGRKRRRVEHVGEHALEHLGLERRALGCVVGPRRELGHPVEHLALQPRGDERRRQLVDEVVGERARLGAVADRVTGRSRSIEDVELELEPRGAALEVAFERAGDCHAVLLAEAGPVGHAWHRGVPVTRSRELGRNAGGTGVRRSVRQRSAEPWSGSARATGPATPPSWLGSRSALASPR